jgi:hypothetical protein
LRPVSGFVLDLEPGGRVFIIAIGKASVPMAEALADILGEKLTGGLVVTKLDGTSKGGMVVAIQKELGRKDEKSELEDLKKQVEAAKMPKDVEEKAIQELKRLEAMPPMSAEATVSRNYLDWLIAVPWFKKTRESRDLKRAEEILHEDHTVPVVTVNAGTTSDRPVRRRGAPALRTCSST